MNKKQIKLFFKKLEEACNFQEDKQGKITWKCKGLELSKKILDDMGIDKKEATIFLNDCKSKGGHCDCEIIFNVQEYYE